MSKDNPPPYEYATQDNKRPVGPAAVDSAASSIPKNSSQPLVNISPVVPIMLAGPSYASTGMPAQVYHYANPNTGESITTHLPPNHPEMICLQEGHVRRTKFGLLGVLAAIIWFPLGIGVCLLDRRVTCDRCGRTIEDGVLCG